MQATGTTKPTKPLRTWTIEGTTDEGFPETTVVTIERNPDWSRGTADTEPRYLVVRTIDDEADYDDGSDSKADAVELAQEWTRDARDAYAQVEADRREAREEALDCLASDWTEGPDRSAVEALACLIGGGKGAAALDALRAAGLARATDTPPTLFGHPKTGDDR
jgi:hypothetical protein